MFKSVGDNLSSWWGGGTSTDSKEVKQVDDKAEGAKEPSSDPSCDGEKIDKQENRDESSKSDSTKTDEKPVTDSKESKEGDSQEEPSEDAQTKVVNTAKEWGSYLFNVTKAATKTVTQTAKQLKSKVEETHILDQTILGDFSKEQERFMHDKKEKKKHSEAAVPPWVGYNEEEAMKAQILALSSDKRNFLRNPPSGAQFQFDFEAMQPVAKATLEEDPELEKMRFDLVPKQVNEEHFWRNYFYRVSLIKQSTQLTSLAERTGTTGEVSSTKEETTDKNTKEPPTVIKITQPTPEQEEYPHESLTQEAEFISDDYLDNGMSEEELRNEMQQLGMDEKKQDPSPEIDDLPEWEKELQAELNEYEVITDDLDDADLESQILQEIEEESK